jgi:hypothetical protein
MRDTPVDANALNYMVHTSAHSTCSERQRQEDNRRHKNRCRMLQKLSLQLSPSGVATYTIEDPVDA